LPIYCPREHWKFSSLATVPFFQNSFKNIKILTSFFTVLFPFVYNKHIMLWPKTGSGVKGSLARYSVLTNWHSATVFNKTSLTKSIYMTKSIVFLTWSPNVNPDYPIANLFLSKPQTTEENWTKSMNPFFCIITRERTSAELQHATKILFLFIISLTLHIYTSRAIHYLI